MAGVSAIPVGAMGGGILRVVSNRQLMEQEQREAAARVAAEQQAVDQQMTALAAHIRQRWEEARNHRNSAQSGPDGISLNERLLAAQRMFNGQYAPSKLAQIRQFGGSEVYARVVAVKCRGASSLLRDVYLGADKPWQLEPTPVPTIPDDAADKITKLLSFEIDTQLRNGQMLDQMALNQRAQDLMDAAQRAAGDTAKKEAKEADKQLDDVLVEGGFYEALAAVLSDLPLFPFVVLKGPTVRMTWDIRWEQGKPVTTSIPRMFWDRVSPFDFYWSPGASDIRNAETFERQRTTRADLSEVMDLPGYNTEAIKRVLEVYGRGGLHDWLDSTDQQRAQAEGRENPNLNRSHFIDSLEYNGMVPARMLIEWGMDPAAAGIDDPDKDVQIQAWLIDRWVIKAQLTPSPRRRPNYFVTAFEKVPGQMAGNALPDILEDIQDVANAALRSLVNNQAMASGPQVEITQDRAVTGTDITSLYPWKRWYVTSDPMAGSQNQPAIKFYQPNSHAQEFLGIYKEMTMIADELSAIPRYITGSGTTGGAGRTASGLSMLMNNASKILQTVAANVDRDIMQPLLQNLYDMVMLVDAGVKLRGDENVRIRGVAIAQKREMERQRQLEVLRLTANPVDMQIMGAVGRGKLLRATMDGTGFEGEDIIPEDGVLQAAMGPAALPGAPPPGPGGPGAGPGSQQAPAAGPGPMNTVQPGPASANAPAQGGA